MKIAGEQVLAAPREKVWALFNDPARLAKLIPGCEKLDTLAPDQFAGTINVGVAAVKGTYNGKLTLEDKRPPEHYKMVVDGKGKQGFVRGSGTLDLAARDARTTVVTFNGDVQVGGPLIQVGQRVIDSAAKMMLGQFFAAAEAELRAEAAGTAARHGFFINFWRWVVRELSSLFARK
jgi:carbon monoxide dehydrogenase subunit G